MASVEIDKIINQFNVLCEKPVKFLTVQKDLKDDFKKFVKSLYDFTKSEEKSSKSRKNQALAEIIVDEFDEEQIWQQIELQNSECWDQITWDVANCISNKSDLSFPIKLPEIHSDDEVDTDDKMSENNDDNDSEMSDPEMDIDEQPKFPKKSNKTIAKKSKPSIVDDKFFKINDMEKFLLNEEKMEEKGKSKKTDDEDDDSIDLFEDVDDEDSEEEGKDMMYSDFFNDEADQDENDDDNDDEQIDNVQSEKDVVDDRDKKSWKKTVRFLEPDSGSESDGSDDIQTDNSKLNINSTANDEKKSEFELRQQRLQQTISRLEEKHLKDAPWQLKGEVDAKKRPENSLLQEVLDFDLTTRPPPIITEQTTVTLEGLIKQRVKDKAWDDVVRKEKPVDDQLNFKKTAVLDQSKSKMSLAQVYEAEYLKQKQEKSGEVEEEEPESHKEIREAMNKLFSKLDALSHYHYTPKAPTAEVKIVSNTPAISMEEVAPVATSDATLLAPEEIKRKQKGDLMSKDERTKTDKNRERRKKKKLQKQKGGVQKVTDHRNTKKGVESTDKSVKTSKAFFQQLNDDATSIIKKKNVASK